MHVRVHRQSGYSFRTKKSEYMRWCFFEGAGIYKDIALAYGFAAALNDAQMTPGVFGIVLQSQTFYVDRIMRYLQSAARGLEEVDCVSEMVYGMPRHEVSKAEALIANFDIHGAMRALESALRVVGGAMVP